jgi:hypothetical protein
MILENGYCRNRQENIGNCWNMKAYQLVRKFLLRADSIKKRVSFSKELKKLIMTIKFSWRGTSKSPAKICKKKICPVK